MEKVSSASQTSGFTTSQTARIAVVAELNTPPIWVKSKWKWQELNDQSVSFDLTTPNGRLSGIGRFKSRPDEYDRIAVDIFSSVPMTQGTASVVRIWLGSDAVNKIEEHPTQHIAKFMLKA